MTRYWLLSSQVPGLVPSRDQFPKMRLSRPRPALQLHLARMPLQRHNVGSRSIRAHMASRETTLLIRNFSRPAPRQGGRQRSREAMVPPGRGCGLPAPIVSWPRPGASFAQPAVRPGAWKRLANTSSSTEPSASARPPLAAPRATPLSQPTVATLSEPAPALSKNKPGVEAPPSQLPNMIY